MADNPRIEVEVGANVTGLQSGMNKAEKAVSGIGRASSNTAPQIGKLTKATSSYNGVGIEFSRIIQDAPFGIIGVANNITQLTQQMSSGKQAGASYTQMIKGIFTGSNLLVLGISALTSVFVILQQKGFFKTKKEAKDLTTALEEYRSKLTELKQVSLEGQNNAIKEISNFRALRTQAESLSVSEKNRLLSVKELQSTYPDYLGNLTQEQILTGKVGNAYQLLSESLIKTAKARSAQDKIGQNFLNILTLEEKLLSNKNEQEKLSLITSQKAVEISGTGLSVITKQDVAQSKIRELQSEQLEILEQILPLKEEESRLTNFINKSIDEGVTFTKDLKGAVDSVVKSTMIWGEVNDSVLSKVKQDLSEYNNLLSQNNKLRDQFEKATGGLTGQEGEALSDPLDIQGLDILGGLSSAPIVEIADSYSENLDKIKLKAEELQAVFTGVGALIGKAFGNNPALGQFVAQFASFAVKLIATNFKIAGSNAVAGATQASVATGPLAPFTLPAFIATSLGLIASAFASFGGGSRSIGSVGSGISSSTSGTSFVSNAQSANFDKSIGLSGDFRIDGRDLVYVINEAQGAQI